MILNREEGQLDSFHFCFAKTGSYDNLFSYFPPALCAGVDLGALANPAYRENLDCTIPGTIQSGLAQVFEVTGETEKN